MTSVPNITNALVAERAQIPTTMLQQQVKNIFFGPCTFGHIVYFALILKSGQNSGLTVNLLYVFINIEVILIVLYWTFLSAGVLALMVLLIVMLTLSALLLSPNHASLIAKSRPKPKWRSLGEPTIPVAYGYSGQW